MFNWFKKKIMNSDEYSTTMKYITELTHQVEVLEVQVKMLKEKARYYKSTKSRSSLEEETPESQNTSSDGFDDIRKLKNPSELGI